MYQKCWYEYCLFSSLNFLRAAILNFYDLIWLPPLLKINVLLYTAMEQPYYVIKIQNGAAWEISKQKQQKFISIFLVHWNFLPTF